MERREVKTLTHYRIAKTGEYVTKEYAEKNPKTTVKETDKIRGKRK